MLDKAEVDIFKKEDIKEAKMNLEKMDEIFEGQDIKDSIQNINKNIVYY